MMVLQCIMVAMSLSQMNTSLLHPSGALLLEPMGQVIIEVKMTNKDPISITYDTPADKVKGQSLISTRTCEHVKASSSVYGIIAGVHCI